MPTCPKCKSEQADNARFCSQCSAPLTATEKRKSPTTAIVLGILLLLLLVVYIAQNGSRSVPNQGSPNQSANQGGGSVLAQFVKSPRTATIVNSAATVKATGFSWYSFTIPVNARGPITVQGHFTAAGGTGNDIECYIVDDDGLENLKNGHAASTYYNSGKVTASSINATLPTTGTFHIVLDNRFSLLTPKAVQITANLNYVQ